MKEFHPVANLFPFIEGDEFEELKRDIKANGQLEAIWLHQDGRIIDGRNRYRACMAVGVEPRFRTWNGQGSLVQFVLSLNLHRRHLSSSQRAALAVDILPMLEEEARERQGTRNDLRPNIVEIVPQSSASQPSTNGKSREQAATILQTNSRYVQSAKTLKVEAPDLLAEVKAGTKTIPQAARELIKRQKVDPPPLPESTKYRVVYADPPWQYGNSGVIGETDNYGHVERHYPSMSITELCNMGPKIRQMCEPDAVLFLWTTSPLLEESFDVIRSWGFKYKTSFVWDKVKHNFGHYNSVRHEFLLICTRGSCTPDNPKLYDSVVVSERTDKHSEKPQEFRDIIDTLYPHGRRIELFARDVHSGWDRWGNEAC